MLYLPSTSQQYTASLVSRLSKMVIQVILVSIPPKDILVKVPFEFCIVACDYIVVGKIGEVIATSPVAIGAVSTVGRSIVEGVRREATKQLKYLKLKCCRCERDKGCSRLKGAASSPSLQPCSQVILDPGKRISGFWGDAGSTIADMFELWVFLTDNKGSHQSASSLRHRWRNTLGKKVRNLTNVESGCKWMKVEKTGKENTG